MNKTKTLNKSAKQYTALLVFKGIEYSLNIEFNSNVSYDRARAIVLGYLKDEHNIDFPIDSDIEFIN